MIMLPFGAQVTGKRESLRENHVLNRKDTLISDFSLLIVRIHPATRQALAGQKYHVGLAKSGGVRHFLARVEPALEFVSERVKEGFDVHHLHDVTARNMPEKHGTSFCFGKAASWMNAKTPERRQPVVKIMARHMHDGIDGNQQFNPFRTAPSFRRSRPFTGAGLYIFGME